MGRESSEPYDCVILGAGPAGLTALTYLARFHRRVVALGTSAPGSRTLLIDRSHNLPGYPGGVSGPVLLKRLCEQAEKAGGEVRTQRALRVEGSDGAFRIRVDGDAPLPAKKVILATGVLDRQPDIPDLHRHAGEFIRYCPICDGYEHTGQRLGILGAGEEVARHALFLRTFSEDVSVFLHGAPRESLGRREAALADRRIPVYEPRITCILGEGSRSRGAGVLLEDGSEHPLDVLYTALGCDTNVEPVRDLGVCLDEEGYVQTDRAGETSVRGIYAAGDLVSNINQISVAFGQAAVAAVQLHNALDDTS
jgi:thioredoxin reductase (NADPH)